MSGINVTCCVRKCPTKLPQNRKNFQVFSLPADRPTKRKWLNALKKASVPVHSGVCRRHFTGIYFNLHNYCFMQWWSSFSQLSSSTIWLRLVIRMVSTSDGSSLKIFSGSGWVFTTFFRFDILGFPVFTIALE